MLVHHHPAIEVTAKVSTKCVSKGSNLSNGSLVYLLAGIFWKMTCLWIKVRHTSVGRKFAPVEGLSHDLVCTGSIYHVHFAWQVWHGQLSPRFKFNKLKSFSGVEIDQNHVDKRILGGKGFAVGRLKRHNFCPASALRNRCCIDTKRCSGGYTQPQVLRLRWH